jgi:hypothetical protein
MIDVFYVQSSKAYDKEELGSLGPGGWETFPHCFQALEDADRQMAALERGASVVQVQDDDGTVSDVTERIAAVYRVVSYSELESEGYEAVAEAKQATKHRPQGFPPGSGRVDEDGDDA